jgi:hypothetical protein
VYERESLQCCEQRLEVRALWLTESPLLLLLLPFFRLLLLFPVNGRFC